ncbi:MAG TPA: hypothetical protein VMV09_09015 [Candidatus Saccharimonadales bacterium]|nr:hypothetical protein [Candidatus Saccharimonadales bacterium]
MSGRRADRPADPRFVAGWQRLIAHAEMRQMGEWLCQQPFAKATAMLLWYYWDRASDETLASVDLEVEAEGHVYRSDRPGDLSKIREFASPDLAVLAAEWLNPTGWPDAPESREERVLTAIHAYLELRNRGELPSEADVASWGLS